MFAAILKSFRFDSIAFLFFASKNYVFWEATVVTKEIKIVFNFPVCCKFLESFQVCSVCFSLLIKKKRNCIHQDLNRGPLACLAETIPLDQRGFDRIVEKYTHLYTVFFFWSHATPIFFFWPIFFQTNFNSASLFPANFFPAKFFFGQNFFGPNFFFGQFFFSVKSFFQPNFFSAKFFFLTFPA